MIEKTSTGEILDSIFSKSVENFEKSGKKFLEFHLVYISALQNFSGTNNLGQKVTNN